MSLLKPGGHFRQVGLYGLVFAGICSACRTVQLNLSAKSARVSCPASTSGTLYTFITALPKPGFVSPPRYDWCAVGERLGQLIIMLLVEKGGCFGVRSSDGWHQESDSGTPVITVQPPGGVVGPTRRNTNERKFPPDDPNDMLVSTAHWSIQGLQGIIH